MKTPEATIDDLMEIVADISNEPKRAQAPYYRYGEKWYATNEGVPPQVRWMPLTWSIEQRSAIQGQVYDPSQPLETLSYGTIGTLVQVMACTVWGSTEENALKELRLVLLGIQRLMGSASPDQISQGGYIGITGQWDQVTDLNKHGHSLSFTWTIKNHIPEVENPPALPETVESILVTPLEGEDVEILAVEYTTEPLPPEPEPPDPEPEP